MFLELGSRFHMLMSRTQSISSFYAAVMAVTLRPGIASALDSMCRKAWSRLLSAVLLAVLLSSQPSAAADDNHGVTFLFPTEGLTFYYLDTINVTYLSDFPHPNLYTFCDGGSRYSKSRPMPPAMPTFGPRLNSPTPPPVRSTPSAPYNGSTLVLLNFTSSTPCYFNLRPGTVAGQGANGASFVLVDGQRSLTTVGLSEPLTAPTSTTSNTPPVSPTSSGSGSTGSTGSTGSSGSSSSGLSGGASAGIGVGVALGVIALAGAIGFWVWRRRKARKAAAGGSYAVAAAGVDMSGPHLGTGPAELDQQGVKPPVSHRLGRRHELGEANMPPEMLG